jgi:hypothetical protein
MYNEKKILLEQTWGFMQPAMATPPKSMPILIG